MKSGLDKRVDAPFRKGRSGVTFDEVRGRLFVFEPRSVLVLSTWPGLYAWKRTARKGWHNVRPEIRLLTPANDAALLSEALVEEPSGQLCLDFRRAYSAKRDAAWQAWREQIPLATRQLVTPFQERQWHLLSFLARCGGAAEDLLRGNPALAFALASSWVFRKPAVQRPLRSVRSLLPRSQNRILEWLQWPASSSVRQILMKVPPESTRVTAMLYLRDTLRSPMWPEQVKLLRHLPRLDASVLRLICDARFFPRVTGAFLRAMSEHEYPGEILLLCKDTWRMHQLLFEEEFAGRFHSIVALQRYHDELTQELNEQYRTPRRTLPAAAFPAPPIPGTSHILPLTELDQLVEEGRCMEHCVASYAWEVFNGSYFYQVLASQRCTLEIRRGPVGWRIAQLSGVRNTPAKEADYAFVQSWLQLNDFGRRSFVSNDAPAAFPEVTYDVPEEFLGGRCLPAEPQHAWKVEGNQVPWEDADLFF